MNVLLKGREVSFYLEDPGAKIVFAWGDFGEAAETGAESAGAELILVKPGEFEKLLAEQEPVRDVADRTAEDTAVILYTSGTTGKPKGAELTHANLYRNSAGVSKKLGEMSEDDVLLGALPLFHSFGQTCTMNSAVSVGATVTMLPRFDPDKALEIIDRDKVTIFQGVPTMYNAMLHSASCDSADCSSLRTCMSGGAAMPAELMRAFEERFGCIILEGYGLSETSPVASFNHPDKERKPGSIGTPIEGVEMQVWDDDGNEVAQGEVGEIVIRGHNIMKGYWNRDDANKEAITEEGWFRTGDMAKVDEDGYFFIVDRKKDLIIRGGYNVYPREIEEVLYEHPAIQEAAVVGVPHDELGEEVGAAVVLKEGESVEAEELKSYVKEQVAAYKYPRRIWFVDELPKGPTGKILKREIEVPEQVEASAGS
jgi:long-chain acyl-CoA synthetase